MNSDTHDAQTVSSANADASDSRVVLGAFGCFQCAIMRSVYACCTLDAACAGARPTE